MSIILKLWDNKIWQYSKYHKYKKIVLWVFRIEAISIENIYRAMKNIMIYIKTKIYIWLDVLFCTFLFNNHINTSNFIKKNHETEFRKKQYVKTWCEWPLLFWKTLLINEMEYLIIIEKQNTCKTFLFIETLKWTILHFYVTLRSGVIIIQWGE